MSTRVCTLCGATVPSQDYCAACTESWPNRPKPETMTPDQREAEMRSLRIVEVEFGLMHQRIEQLVGRPVWTHEMGLNWEGLEKEARWETRPATMEEVIGPIPEEKRLVVVVQNEEGGDA